MVDPSCKSSLNKPQVITLGALNLDEVKSSQWSMMPVRFAPLLFACFIIEARDPRRDFDPKERLRLSESQINENFSFFVKFDLFASGLGFS